MPNIKIIDKIVLIVAILFVVILLAFANALERRFFPKASPVPSATSTLP